MKIKVFINDTLYKTMTLLTESYNPSFVWPQIEADKNAGLLTQFGIPPNFKPEDGKFAVRIEKVK
jgi:hypothetical protein